MGLVFLLGEGGCFKFVLYTAEKLSSVMRVFGECLLGNGLEKSVGVDKEL